MGCCGLFKKHKKHKSTEQAFVARPVQQRIQGGNVSYTTSSSQYTQVSTNGGYYPPPPGPTQQQQHGSNPNYASQLAANKAMAAGAATMLNQATGHKINPKYVSKGADMAATKFTEYQAKQQLQPGGRY
ncbi:hypothetical protein VTI74DRAFT_4714 [Chaetomium olivicolor]